MKRNKMMVGSIVVLVVGLLAATVGAQGPGAEPAAPVNVSTPDVVSYQGQVTVGGSPYNDTGYFKFVIVSGAGGTVTLWPNDGTSVTGLEPTAAAPVTVSDGLFQVLLGDTA